MSSSTATLGAAFTQRAVETDDFRIRYFDAGEGDPLVVLHGAGGPRHSLALDILAGQFRVILLEMPGFGEQSNPHLETVADMATAIDAATRALGLDCYHLLGTSMGGAVALQVALKYPERLTALVLEGPAVFQEGAVAPGPHLSPDTMRDLFRRHPDRTPAWELPDPAVMARTWPLVERLVRSTMDNEDQLVAHLPQCQVRTLVVFGDDDGIIPAHNGRAFRRLMPNCAYVLVHQAAHDIQADRPEAFAKLVSDFLTRGWAFLLPQESTLITP